MTYIIQELKESLTRACRIMRLSRSVYQYEQKQNDDTDIETMVKHIAHTHKRYGFRKIFHIIRHKGFTWNYKRVYRLYKELGLHMKKKPKKRLSLRTKVTLYQPATINEVWSLDYMSDALVNGRKFRTVNVIDDYSREAIIVTVSVSPACRVITILDYTAQMRGYPRKIRMDNGPENISKTMERWA